MCEGTDSLEQSGAITVDWSPESPFSFRLIMDLPLPRHLPHCQGYLFAAGRGSQGFRCPVLCAHSLGPHDTRSQALLSHVAHVDLCQQLSSLCPGHFRHKQAVVLANSLENGDVPELVLGPCPHLPEEAGFPDSAIVPTQSLKLGNYRDVEQEAFGTG